MKILLTGGTGFIGRAFIREALARNHEVAALILPQEIVPDTLRQLPIQWLAGTLADAPWSEVEKFQPEVCLHAAWIATPGEYLESPLNHQLVKWSVDFVRRATACGTAHVLSLGSCIEYRMGRDPLSEITTPISPISTYARCKNELRLALEEQSRAQNFSLAWGRVFYPYGAGEHPARLCSSLIRTLRASEAVVLKTPGSLKDYIYITDLARALVMALEQRCSGPINLGTGIGVEVRQLALIIARLLGKPELVREQTPPVPDPYDCVVADAAKLYRTGWRPVVPLDEGLKLLIHSLQS